MQAPCDPAPPTSRYSVSVVQSRPTRAQPKPQAPQPPSHDLVVWNPQLPASRPVTPDLRNT